MSLPASWTSDWMRLCADRIAEQRADLNGLDREIGDGDHGENLARGFDAVVERMPPAGTPSEVLAAAARALIATVGGAAGPLYGTALLRAAGAIGGHQTLDGTVLATMLAAAAEGIRQRGRAEPGDKTMLDAWGPAAEAAARSLSEGRSEPDILAAAADAAEHGAAATEPLTARKGRASYLGERAAGHRDPGAVSSVLMLRAAADAAGAPNVAVAGSAPDAAGDADAETARIGIVAVSHSERITAGLRELARQMAPDVPMATAGGTDDGGIGTSAAKVRNALQTMTDPAGVLIIGDLGSAILTAEAVLEELDRGHPRYRLVDAPLVEGTIAAAVAAQTGATLEEVAEAAETARGETAVGSAAPPGTYVRTVTLVNEEGLHARPAAEFVKLASTFPARVSVNGADARSLLAILSLGLVKGAEARIATDEADGARAVDALAALVESGFQRPAGP